MRITHLFILAAKYLRRYLRRYVFLLMALTFGFAVITVITALQDGMYQAVYNSAQGHYAGDLFVVGFDKESKTRFRISKTDAVMEAIQESGLNPRRIVKRTQFGGSGVVYFHGTAVRHKYVMGVDWQNERGYFSSLDYVDGGPEELADTKDIFLSKPVSEELQARVGDEVVLEVRTRTGQKNTGRFIVRGIVDSSTIFGYYKCYVSRENLNKLLRYGPEESSSIGLYFSRGSNLNHKARQLQEALEGRIDMGPLLKSREEINSKWVTSGGGISHWVLTLKVYLSEVTDLLSAINLVGYFMYVMMLMIVLASIFVTYKLILYERAREVGTMRSIGFYASDVQFVLVTEAMMLFAVSIVFGLLIARAALWAISMADFSWIPSFEIFMQDGRLKGELILRTIAVNIGIMVLILIPSVWLPASRMARADLPETLSGGNQ